VIELDVVAGTTAVTTHGINAHGEVVGEAIVDGDRKAFVWLPFSNYGMDPGMNLLDDSFSRFVSSRAYDINDDGLVVGDVLYSAGRFPRIWDLDGSQDQFINTPANYVAYGINDQLNPIIIGGKNVGADITDVECVDTPGFIYDLVADQSEDLPAPAGVSGRDSVAFGVNTPSTGDLRIAGSTYQNNFGAGCGQFNCCLEQITGAFWDVDTSIDAATLKRVGQGQFEAGVIGYAVNADGLVVGSGHDSDDTFGPMDDECRRRAVVWDEADPSNTVLRLDQIDAPSGEDQNDAFDIRGTESNLPMEVVGWSILNQEALLWRWNDTSGSWDLVRLNDAACTAGIIALRRAEAINANGWVAGHTLGAGWVLIPFDEYHSNVCPADIANSGSSTCPEGVVNVFDLLHLLSGWGVSGSVADISGPSGVPDGTVDVFDLLELLASWGVCIGNPPSPSSLEDELNDAGLTMNDWDAFEDVMTNGTQQEQENYKCWMENHLTGCVVCPPCPGSNPYRN